MRYARLFSTIYMTFIVILCMTKGNPESTVYALDSSERRIGVVERNGVEYTLVVPIDYQEYDANVAYFVVTDHSYDLKGKVEIYDVFNVDNDGISDSIPVTAIGREAFEDSYLTEIIIPDTVTTIQDKAFYNCDNLKSVTIPDSVERINNEAFYSCDNLSNVTIGSVDNENINHGKTVIGEKAFSRCEALTNVTLGENVTKIKKDAFRYTNLETITIPDSIKTIWKKVIVGNHAFDESTVIIDKTGKKLTPLISTDHSIYEIVICAFGILAITSGVICSIAIMADRPCYVRDYDQKRFRRKGNFMITYDKKDKYEKIAIRRIDSDGVIYSHNNGLFYSTGSSLYRTFKIYFSRPLKYGSDEYWKQFDAMNNHLNFMEHLSKETDSSDTVQSETKRRHQSRRSDMEKMITDFASLTGDDMYYDPVTGLYASVDSEGTFKNEFGNPSLKIIERGDGWIKTEDGRTYESSDGTFKNGHYTDWRDSEYWNDDD